MSSTVLVITALEDVTADWVISALNERGVKVVRVDPADIGPGLSFDARISADAHAWSGRLRTTSREVELTEISAVYYRRPSPWRFDHLPQQECDFAMAEARHGLGGLLANLANAAYVNHPSAITRADFKPAQLHVAAQLGLNIPPTLVTNDIDAARRFATEHEPIIYKTFRGLPSSKDGRAGAIWTQRVNPDAFDETLSVTAHLFQAEVPKVADARVTVVGSRLFASRIETSDGVLDWRRGDWEKLTHTPIEIPDPIAAALGSYLASFELVFGCFDFALTGNGDVPEHWIWVECNPNGQWGWLPDAPEITDAFADILQKGSAL
ncbi:ATP-grasp ribosomal peptide maturase [Nonomuraea sp. NPDC049269]|uniref:ATP-grasp ribosomal peptide maturase n=1 Tax=Nonomuraea sp. NPDC049269 TaxID=3364349 RepID=UPI003716EDD6